MNSTAAQTPETPVVSIVIVNYNVREFLQQCLESIDRSAFDLPYEILVIDNNSHDQSVATLSPKFPNVRFIALSENIGFGRANNIGIKQAQGRYILLLNPDTLIQEDTIATMVRYMDENPAVGISGCKVLNANGTFQVQCRRGFPSPWVSFCKLFGLQVLFPRSPIFAQYNQTFRDENETYMIDAVIGAFMFCRREPLLAISGFDEDFFMYGEDLDLCYRMKQAGFATAYAPLTTIVHFKGESTRRSSINEVKWFYDAMEIFARKHYGTSSLFLLFLRTGIFLRSLLAYGIRHARGLSILIPDLLFVVANLLLAVKLRRGDYFALPDYAFPTVFIVVPFVVLMSMIAVGEYFENKPTVRRSIQGLLVSFFVLSSLTYYWNEYAFSRGVLLMTIGFSLLSSALIRGVAAAADTLFGSHAQRRLLLVGTAEQAEETAAQLQRTNALSAFVVGYAETRELHSANHSKGIPLLGHREYVIKLIEQYDIDEVVVIGGETRTSENIRLMESAVHLDVRFHFARDAASVVALGIAEGISSQSKVTKQVPLLALRNRIVKRCIDIAAALVALLIVLPVVILIRPRLRYLYSRWFAVLAGKMSVVGVFPVDSSHAHIAKIGVTGLAHISYPGQLSEHTINELNEYYIKNYSPSLDLDICIKSLRPSRHSEV
ncbi:MAG: hypothetical protein RL156_145 [Bacteroidota bacterium]|jgi:GT2 family glycosyltransferase